MSEAPLYQILDMMEGAGVVPGVVSYNAMPSSIAFGNTRILHPKSYILQTSEPQTQIAGIGHDGSSWGSAGRGELQRHAQHHR